MRKSGTESPNLEGPVSRNAFRSDSLRPYGPYNVHGILQAAILEWVAFPFSSRSSQPRNRTRVSCIAGDSLLTEPSGKPSFSAEAFAMAVPVSHVFGALKRTEFSRVLLSAWDPDTGVI